MKYFYLLFFILSCIQSTAQENEYQLQEVTVSSNINPEKTAKRIALNFAAKYAPDFACEILQYRTVSCNGKYCEFNAYQGIMAALDFNQSNKDFYWDNPANRMRLAPLEVFRSNAYNGNGTLLELSGIQTDNTFTLKSLYTNYMNHFMSNAFLGKKSLEVCSPLNPKMISFFTYTIRKMYENKQGEQLILLDFENKENTFPDKIKLYGKGSILYNASLRSVLSITMSDHIDFYSSFVRKKTYQGASATKHSITIQYTQIDNHIYPQSIAFELEWIKPEIADDADIYYIQHNSRRNPFKNKLQEKDYYEFSNFIPLDAAQKEFVKKNMSWHNSYPDTYYCAPYEPEQWNNIRFKYVDLQKIKTDLNNPEPLEGQAVKNGLNGYIDNQNYSPKQPVEKEQAYIQFSREYYKIAREKIYPALFGRSYR